ncbi:hypothetical protein [Carboxydocella sp. ULO1]|uniref:Cas10/Cmr2 second palm domain-containing protein n=1 Tax=Carboxydocella sp. ULO1 TaxID=1926599 RepID=UPI0009AD6CAF|nr:hypothetical protein [Carboxydocella sp. ULO1]GAW27546.1 hypothetical protein ULO1_01160 [Carboxydocella sp. ULO1]
MIRYLLAAEADKIQDFIFRSSRLREVVGGSQLLSRFCAEVPGYLLPLYGGNPTTDIIINDGGSFRILFNDADQARDFGEHLAEIYRLATGGTLTVAEPVQVGRYFSQASVEAEEGLRRKKRWFEDWQNQEQFPYMAICASCGTGLAVEHRVYHEDEKPQYLCVSCLNKSAERADADELGLFLKAFYQEVVGEEGLTRADWPGKTKRRERSVKDPLEDIADYDTRRYVAYLLADGNSMGEVFSQCQSPEQMRALSRGLSQAIRRALAKPTKMIMMDHNQLEDRPDFIPVLPLILGGDDLFALIPAPWALDFARCFCQEYESEMSKLAKKVGLENYVSTVSVAVVICKCKFPYALAHEAGESRLKEAKRICKQRFFDQKKSSSNGNPCSVVNFEVVRGGRLVSEPRKGEVRPTLRPYWIVDEGDEWGLPVKQLIEQRWNLRACPKKRLSELKDLYDITNLPDFLNSEKLVRWENKLQKLLLRLEQRSAQDQDAAVKAALKLLGGNEKGYWRHLLRDQDHYWYGHSLPDLLDAWDFALSLDKPRREYEEG